METSTSAAFEQRRKEAETREARRRAKEGAAAPGEAAAAAEAAAEEDGPGSDPVRREAPKIGRNDPCYCGSGKKYKRCHGG